MKQGYIISWRDIDGVRHRKKIVDFNEATKFYYDLDVPSKVIYYKDNSTIVEVAHYVSD